MQQILHKQLSANWLRAAVLGSLWASFEIIIGSFLHNLRIPLSGTLLTAASVFLIVAFIQFWKDPGMIWRAGLICALMKSLSPSAVILGPMIGIFTEALILWIAVVLLGRNLFAFMLGGALAVASALVHKVVNLLILYGFDLIRVFEGFYLFAVRNLRIGNADPTILVAAIAGIYLLLGALAALAGYVAGKKYNSEAEIDTDEPLSGDFAARNELFSLSRVERYSLPLLLAHLTLIVVCLWLLNASPLQLSFPVCAAYLTACFIRYKSAFRYLRKPGLWLQFLFITLIAAYLLEGYSSGNYFSFSGLIIGLKMNLRAFVIMTGFAAISTELKNPLVRSILYERGLANLYQSLSLSFGALPRVLAHMPDVRAIAGKKSALPGFFFSMAKQLLIRFENELARRPIVYIITQKVGAGKTTFVESLIGRLKQEGFRMSGFIAPGIFKGGEKTGFRIRDLSNEKEYTLAAKSPVVGWKRQGHYYFDPGTIRTGVEILLKISERDADMIVIDEVGPMEMSNEGWATAIEELCRINSLPQIWVVRHSLAKKAARKWNTGNVYIYDTDTVSSEEVASQIIQNHSKKALNTC